MRAPLAIECRVSADKVSARRQVNLNCQVTAFFGFVGLDLVGAEAAITMAFKKFSRAVFQKSKALIDSVTRLSALLKEAINKCDG